MNIIHFENKENTSATLKRHIHGKTVIIATTDYFSKPKTKELQKHKTDTN